MRQQRGSGHDKQGPPQSNTCAAKPLVERFHRTILNEALGYRSPRQFRELQPQLVAWFWGSGTINCPLDLAAKKNLEATSLG